MRRDSLFPTKRKQICRNEGRLTIQSGRRSSSRFHWIHHLSPSLGRIDSVALALLPLFFLLQGGLSQKTAMFVAAYLLALLGVLLWNVYCHKGCWIRFSRNDITFKRKGMERKYNLADLVSIHCPTAAQKRYGDFVQLKFKSGPKVRFSDHSLGFEEAKDELLKVLARSGNIKECVVVGDFEFPRNVAPAGNAISERQESPSQKASATPFRTSNLATRESRLSAAFIDVGICFAVSTVWAPFASPLLVGLAPPRDHPPQGQVVLMYATLALLIPIAITYLALNGYLLATRGQSIGKWLLGIQIVDAETNELLSIRRIIMQRVIPVFLVMALPGIGILLLLIDIGPLGREDQRCVHDLLACSKVIKYGSIE